MKRNPAKYHLYVQEKNFYEKTDGVIENISKEEVIIVLGGLTMHKHEKDKKRHAIKETDRKR